MPTTQKSTLADNYTLDKLVTMVTETCLVALDKTNAAVRRSGKYESYAKSAVRVGSIAEKLVRAAKEVRMTLPVDKR